MNLTPSQTRLLQDLEDGHRIIYSRDGDCGWLSGTNEILADRDIWALRNNQYIDRESDEREDDYGCDKINSAGRAALAQSSHKATERPHD